MTSESRRPVRFGVPSSVCWPRSRSGSAALAPPWRTRARTPHLKICQRFSNELRSTVTGGSAKSGQWRSQTKRQKRQKRQNTRGDSDITMPHTDLVIAAVHRLHRPGGFMAYRKLCQTPRR